MKDIEKKKISNTNQTKRSVRSEKRDRKPVQDSPRKTLPPKEPESRSSDKPSFKIPPSVSKTSTDSSEVYEDVVIHYIDDALKTGDKFDEENKDENNDFRDIEKEDSDSETVKDSVSSYGGSQRAEEKGIESPPRGLKKVATNNSSRVPKVQNSQGPIKMQNKVSQKIPKNDTILKSVPPKATTKAVSENSKPMQVPPKPSSESSEGVEEKPIEDLKELDIVDEVSNGGHSVKSDDTSNTEENTDHVNEAIVDSKIEELESKVDKLEEELREVAALEIALYSIIPEHGSSAHKVHTPARRLSRLYIHACKYSSQNKRGTVARNIVLGLVLVAKACSNDVSRLTFWLSNSVVLRQIICQAFGHSCNSSSLSRIFELNGDRKLYHNRRADNGSKQTYKDGFMQFIDDWQETRTLTAALEKVESWIFSRVIESIWWQTLMPNMQSPIEKSNGNQTMGKLSGPALGNHQQGTLSVNLWKSAFEDGMRKLCPVRSGGHICGCLPVLSRMVMEQCTARLDVAMFNAILRESAHEIPTDPVSDPIVDSKVLPIPAGDLSFGSGAQLKNSVGNWSRRLTELFGVEANNSPREEQNNEDGDKVGGDAETKHFNLLNQLSDLLMLPKDLLMDRSVRTEVCPSISLQLVIRILCNFSLDEFCPDPVPGAALEALNSECLIERKFSADSTNVFPYTAPPAQYTPPSLAIVAEKEVSEIDGKTQLARSSSSIQRKGYTSDEELDTLEFPLASLFDKSPSTSPTVLANGVGNGKFKEQNSSSGGNTRYDLLREVWSV